jgi:hypothetical protein
VRLVIHSAAPKIVTADASVRWRSDARSVDLDALPRGGRRRRWVYAAAGDARGSAGVLCFDAGVLGLGTSFAFATFDGQVHTWDAAPGRAGDVGGLTGIGSAHRRHADVQVDGGSFTIDVPVDGGRLRAAVTAPRTDPVTLVTPTPNGGWNATTKSAGHAAHGTISSPSGVHELDGHGWTDFTDGRQDRATSWRWVAGGGSSVDSKHRVGLQASTGMNGSGVGEDIVWWDGVAHPLTVDVMRPAAIDDLDGPWQLEGPGWQLLLCPDGARAANERVGPIVSRYTQPIGSWTGTLPGLDGAPVEVVLQGVAEEHEARW